MASTNETVNKIVKILDGKKGRDIEVLNISELTTMTDYFIIVTGGSDTQVKALCDNVEEELEKEGLTPVNKEGYKTAQWILLVCLLKMPQLKTDLIPLSGLGRISIICADS